MKHRYLIFLILIHSIYSENAVLQLSEDGKVSINHDEHHQPEANLDINGFMKLKPQPAPPALPKDGMVYLSTEGKFYLYFNQQWNDIPLTPQKPLVDLTFYADLIASSQHGGNSSPSNLIYGREGYWKAANIDESPQLKLSWETPQTISKINLKSHPHKNNSIISGRIVFDDGTEELFQNLKPNSSLTLNFTPRQSKTLTIHFTMNQKAEWKALSMLQVFGDLSLPKYNNLSNPDHITSSSVYSHHYERENVLYQQQGDWASKGEVDPWIKFEWEQPQSLNTMIIKDRANSSDHSQNCKIFFSDGSSLDVTDLKDNGERKVISFDKKTVSWIKIEITGNPKSVNNGLELVKFENR